MGIEVDQLLSLSRAAKLAGVSRRTIQSHIQAGDMEAFEGSVRMSALSRIYPEVNPERSAVLERVRRIQENALYKKTTSDVKDARFLANQVHRLQVELEDAYAQIESYQSLVMELRDRLVVMKEGCARREKQLLQALLGWMSSQMKHQA